MHNNASDLPTTKEPAETGWLLKKLYTVIAFVGLVAMDITLKIFGFRIFYKLVREFPIIRKRRRGVGEARQICAAIDRAARVYFKHAWCLQRSAVGVCMLRLLGFAAEMVIGARRVPFYAHAWVEMNGRVINDDEDKIHSMFAVLDRC